MNGSLALVGSGEYLPAMSNFEGSLIADGVKNGKAARYLQIPTAAGRKSARSKLECACELVRNYPFDPPAAASALGINGSSRFKNAGDAEGAIPISVAALDNAIGDEIRSN